MHYKSDTLLAIVRRLMQPHGATVRELSEELELHRRSILRWLDRVGVQYPNLQGEYINGEREKRWRIPVNENITLPELTTPSAREIEILERYARINETQNRIAEASAIRSILARNEIKGFVPIGTKVSDFEYFIPRQFYIERIVPETLDLCVKALGEDHYVVLEDYIRADGKSITRKIVPLMLLSDQNRYLIGFEYGKRGKPKSFLLTRIKKIKLGENLKKEDLRRKMSFVPEAYIRHAFSVYHEEKEFNVKLEFSGRAAFPATQFHFHPNQKIEKLENGSTYVEFPARGIDAICRHLFSWGENVKIIAPKELIEAYQKKLKKILEKYSE